MSSQSAVCLFVCLFSACCYGFWGREVERLQIITMFVLPVVLLVFQVLFLVEDFSMKAQTISLANAAFQ